jgi:hypothetical protein
LVAILSAVLDEPEEKAARVIASTSADAASSHKDENISINTTGTNLGPPAAGLPPGEPSRQHRDQNRNAQATHASNQNNKKLSINTTGTNLGPPAAGLPPGEPARQHADQNCNNMLIYGSNQNDKKININTTGTNLGPPAAGLPLGKPARKPAVPHGQRQGQEGRARRGRGPQPLNAVLPVVLEQLLGGDAAQRIESIESGETP